MKFKINIGIKAIFSPINKIISATGKGVKSLFGGVWKILAKLVPQKIKDINSNYKIVLGISLFLLVWMLSGIIGKEKPQELDVSGRTNSNIKTVLVKEFFNSPTERIIRLSGKSKEERMVAIKAELSAQVETIIVKAGDDVAADISILKLEQDEVLARLRQAESQENQARLEYQSQQRLLKQKLTSQTSAAQALANYQAAKAGAALAKKQFDSTEVKSPFAGIVEKIYVEHGDFVQPGKLLADIFDYDPMLIMGDLSELEINFIQPGSKAIVNLATGEEVEGTVSYVAKVSDDLSRTFEVQVEIPNADKSLRAGVTAELEFFAGTINAVNIPPSIININAEGKLGVKVIASNNIVEFMPIEIVKAETNEMWVGGLPDGVKIIIRGYGFVDEGEQVAIEVKGES